MTNKKLVQIGEFKKGLPGTTINIDKVSVFEVPADFNVEALYNALTTATKNERETDSLLGGTYVEDMGIRMECLDLSRQTYTTKRVVDMVLKRLEQYRIEEGFDATIKVENLDNSTSNSFKVRKDFDFNNLYDMVASAQEIANENATIMGEGNANEVNIRITFGNNSKEIQLSRSNHNVLLNYLEGCKVA